jgi:hypothetical protein
MDPYLIFIYLTGLTGFSGFIFSKIFSDGVGLSFLIFFLPGYRPYRPVAGK